MHVRPAPDYRRAAELSAERAGVEECYNPETADGVGRKVLELLNGGLTETEAVQVALLNNRAFQARFAEIGVSRADFVQSGLISNPTLALSLRFPDGGGLANFTFGLAQQIADLWKIPIRRKVAAAELEATILTVAHEACALADEVRRCYAELAARERLCTLADEDLKLARRSAELARQRFKAGRAGPLDVNLAEARVLSVQQDAVRLRRDRELARLRLADLLGLARQPHRVTVCSAAGDQPAALPPVDELILTAMRQRLDARIAALRVDAARDEVRNQVAEAFPDVSVGFELERPERRAVPPRRVAADTVRASAAAGRLTAPDIEPRSARVRERNQMIEALLGPTLELTLPVWHQNQPQIAKARYELERRRKQYEQLLDTVACEVRSAALRVRTARRLLDIAAEKGLPLAQAGVETAQHAYQAGRQPIVALLQAQSALIAQRRQLVELQREYAEARSALRLAVGGAWPDGDPACTSRPSADQEGTQ